MPRVVPYRPKDYPLELNDKGIYCFFPFDVLDKEHKGVFKIGLTTKVHRRIDQYHTYLPMGLYFKAFLVNPTKGRLPRESEAQYLARIETFIYDYIKGDLREPGIPINMEIRKRDLGQTEWIYCGSRQVDKAFNQAEKVFGGESVLYNMQLLSEADRDRDTLFKGVIYFDN